MGWDVLLTAALNVSVGLLAKAGFEESLKDLKERLVKADEKKRQKALEAAIKDASKSTTCCIPPVRVSSISAMVMTPSDLPAAQLATTAQLA